MLEIGIDSGSFVIGGAVGTAVLRFVAAFLSLRTWPAGAGVSDGHANSVVVIDLFSRGRRLVHNCAWLLW